MVLIEDADGPTSIAGVMGGARSEVEPDTTRVLMEAANWNGAEHPPHLAEARPAQRGLGPLREAAPARAGDGGAGGRDAADDRAVRRDGRPGHGRRRRPRPGAARRSACATRASTRLLGAPIPRERCAEILRALEFTTDATHRTGSTSPSRAFRRSDVTREADLIEEVARLDGAREAARDAALAPRRLRPADRAPARCAARRRRAHGPGPARDRGLELRRARSSRTGCGSPTDAAAVELENPMSTEQSRLRTTLLGSLLDVARRNRAHGAGDAAPVRGRRRVPARAAARSCRASRYHVGALLIGAVRPPTWREPSPRARRLLRRQGRAARPARHAARAVDGASRRERAAVPAPGPRGARSSSAEQPVGWLGEIHPLVAADWDLEDTVAAFELDLDAVAAARGPTPLYEDLTSFPEVREDLAVIVARARSARRGCSRSCAPRAGRCSQRAEVFDVYRDPERLGEGNVSLALRLSYRAADRTLTDEEVARQREAITAALERELGGRIRAA